MENNTTAGSTVYNVNNAAAEAKCPFLAGELGPKKQQSAGAGPVNRDWWPNQLKLNVLRQNSSLSDPTDANFILVKVDDADVLYNYHAANEIVVRNRNKEILCENCLRITIGTPKENKNLMATLKNYKG